MYADNIFKIGIRDCTIRQHKMSLQNRQVIKKCRIRCYNVVKIKLITKINSKMIKMKWFSCNSRAPYGPLVNPADLRGPISFMNKVLYIYEPFREIQVGGFKPFEPSQKTTLRNITFKNLSVVNHNSFELLQKPTSRDTFKNLSVVNNSFRL